MRLAWETGLWKHLQPAPRTAQAGSSEFYRTSAVFQCCGRFQISAHWTTPQHPLLRDIFVGNATMHSDILGHFRCFSDPQKTHTFPADLFFPAQNLLESRVSSTAVESKHQDPKAAYQPNKPYFRFWGFHLLDDAELCSRDVLYWGSLFWSISCCILALAWHVLIPKYREPGLVLHVGSSVYSGCSPNHSYSSQIYKTSLLPIMCWTIKL